MIKYTICPGQTMRDEKNFQSHVKWIENMFGIIEENGLEDKMHKLEAGEYLKLSFYVSDIGETVCHYFCCTGNKKGHFTQRIQEPSGLTNHANSLELTYE